jgi:hypothetical protein
MIRISRTTLLNIRTHLDGFSREEIAVLAYCGYAWAEYDTDTNRLMERYEWTTAAPFRSFEEILPERWHVRYSNRRLLLFRAIGRPLGL